MPRLCIRSKKINVNFIYHIRLERENIFDINLQLYLFVMGLSSGLDKRYSFSPIAKKYLQLSDIADRKSVV